MQPPRKRLRRLGIVVAGLAGLACLLAIGFAGPRVALAVHSRITYGSWDPATPDRIEFCGRRYYARHGGTSVSREEATSGWEPRLQARWRQVGRTDGGDPYFAMTIQDASRYQVSPPMPCTTELYLRTGADSYRPFVLSGGL